MSKSLRPAAWIVFGLAGAILLYAFTGAASIPPGYQLVPLTTGMLPSLAVPANGQAALVLPSGSTWVRIERSEGSNPAAATALPLPAKGAPLLLTGVAVGTELAVAWTDASNTPGTAILGFGVS